MDLSRIAIEPRLRDSWEAVDMGIAMTRAWWLPLQISWFVPSAILFFCLLPIFSDDSWIAFLIVWWLNPLWDRFPLLLASRALFDEPLNVRAVWSEWWQLFKKDWFAWLTWRRFSPTRSLDMPITVLEQLRGDDRSGRLNVLHRNSSGVAFALTLLCMLFELLTLTAIWSFLLLLIPQEFWQEEMLNGFNNFFWFSQWSVIVWYFALALVSPFYAVAGFALYINRRIELEGWDIEIRFRHLAARYNQAHSNKKSTSKSTAKKMLGTLVPALFVLGLMGTPQPSQAQVDDLEPDAIQSSASQSLAAQDAKDTIVEVLSGEDFLRKEINSGWRFKQKERADGEESSGWFLDALANLLDFLSPFLKFIGSIFSVVPYVIWIIVALVIALVIYQFRDALASVGRRGGKEDDSTVPDVLFGLDLRKESLPDDVPSEVNQLWQQGKHREAIGLLYRATLSSLIHKFSFEFYDGYTEQECADIVKGKKRGKLSDYVLRLTSTWQQLAYAHRLPADAKISELCAEWPQYFSEGRYLETGASESGPGSSSEGDHER